MFIVITFGANQHNVPLAAAAAAVAVVGVALAGVVAHAPLSRVPENTLKFGVGVMLTSFGIFWGAEGAGAHWPGGDAALLAIIPATLGCALAMVAALRRAGGAGRSVGGRRGAGARARVRAFLYDFSSGVTGVSPRAWRSPRRPRYCRRGLTAWWIMPVAALGLLAASLWRAARA